MKTIQAIKEELKEAKEPAVWMEELQHDTRAGVQQALKVWQRAYDKKNLLKKCHIQKQEFDKSFAPFEGAFVAGTDEAGRGPLAGPVVTAAVILPKETESLIGLDDSKKMSKKERERMSELVKQTAVSWAIHIQSVENIDQQNIYMATRESMEKSIQKLTVKPHQVLADAMPLSVGCPSVSIIKGDAKSLVIAAASILAKTTRDQLMEELHEEYPMYGFAQHAGYGTSSHLEAIQLHGPSPHHRKTFEPIKSMLLERS